jgi:hypothetical protein
MSHPIIKTLAVVVVILFSIGWLVPAYLGWQLYNEWLEQYQTAPEQLDSFPYLEAARTMWNLAGLWFLVTVLAWIIFAARKLIPWSG